MNSRINLIDAQIVDLTERIEQGKKIKEGMEQKRENLSREITQLEKKLGHQEEQVKNLQRQKEKIEEKEKKKNINEE